MFYANIRLKTFFDRANPPKDAVNYIPSQIYGTKFSVSTMQSHTYCTVYISHE